MILFRRNSGQFAPDVAYVADWPSGLPYPGAGVVRLCVAPEGVVGAVSLGSLPLSDDLRHVVLPDGRLVAYEPEADPAWWDAAVPGSAHAVCSGRELVVLRGTAAAALLLALTA